MSRKLAQIEAEVLQPGVKSERRLRESGAGKVTTIPARDVLRRLESGSDRHRKRRTN